MGTSGTPGRPSMSAMGGKRTSIGYTDAMTRILSLLAFASALTSGCALSPTEHVKITAAIEGDARQLRAAIWSDLQSNAMIGNGNELAARWANAGGDGDNAPQQHIQDLLCSGSPTLLRCQFGLLRDGGVAMYLGEPAPDRLACMARFRRSAPNDLWSIPRLPPSRGGGHSRITIKCRPVT
jgi:hypothetical protein